MSPLRHGSRLLANQRTRKRSGNIWPLLVLILLLLNVYLFGIRGLPVPDSDASSSDRSPAVGARPDRFESGLGEIRGVAGIRIAERAPATPRAPPRSPGPSRSPGLRFDLEQAVSVAGQRTLEQWCTRIEGAIGRGDSFSTALARTGVSAGEIFDLVEALKPVFDFRRCRVGDRFVLLAAPDGRTFRFVYHASPLVSYRADRRGAKLTGEREERPVEVEEATIGVRIQGSLWQSLARAGGRGALVMRIVDIFAWDIDFYIDTRPGDTIRLLVEKHVVDGQFARYGRILAAEYAGGVGVHRAFWYDSTESTRGYFDEQGGSLRKAFLKSPLKFARISSRYGMRVHPVLGFNKIHHGVDLAAPVGTPVWAPADGTVMIAGRKGASGIMIKLRHTNGYWTVYCHLSRIAAGVRNGARVRQKQVIGAVGNTGRSTGPHLHYGMTLRGRHVDPVRQRFPPANPVPANELAGYLKAIEPLRARLRAIPIPAGSRTASADSAGKDAG